MLYLHRTAKTRRYPPHRGNPGNNDSDNLAVLCRDCHSRVTGDEGLGRRYSKLEVKKYKRSWEAHCAASDSDEDREETETWRPPLDVEVLDFCFQDLRNRPDDSMVVITPYPRRYRAELALTNRSGKVVYVKSIVLTGGRGSVRKEAELHGGLPLDSHEIKQHVATFPLNDDEEPAKAGQFRIEVTPSVGRKTTKSINL